MVVALKYSQQSHPPGYIFLSRPGIARTFIEFLALFCTYTLLILLVGDFVLVHIEGIKIDLVIRLFIVIALIHKKNIRSA
jgi:hypothetical protein